MATLGISSLNKKFTFSLQSKPFNLNKRINTNINTNTNESNKYINNNSNGNKYIKQNLYKRQQNKKDKDLLLKIKEKVSKENLIPKNIKKIKETDEK